MQGHAQALLRSGRNAHCLVSLLMSGTVSSDASFGKTAPIRSEWKP
ncbi:hypothetical protein X805_12860 [Sphaerotilus natans subsp. natans DSM 6575]|uniref:Uncharacterized protein n=1 Tax=Sphaerotilus natans subsp. natans DSM 6575 TaxID=1286631 RepID=A0A059KPI7_9BURK|nr:hypothetical protein X805_12860 [Sphaerotilus natans subsp. natans DSM 6575]